MFRSLSAVVSLTCLSVLVICLLTARAISTQFEQVYFYPVFQHMDVIELEDARAAFENGGGSQLQSYLTRLDRRFGGSHYLLDATGKQVEGTENLAYLLPRVPQTHSRGAREGVGYVTQLSEDGRYWFVATRPQALSKFAFGRFYLLLTVGIIALGALLSAYILFPLRKMAKLVEKIGPNNLGERIHSKRKDEIGALATAYDDMAARLELAFARERQLLQDVSHELRAPLARMNFSVRLARTAEDQAVALDEVKRDLDRLSFLVTELTELSVGPPGGVQPKLKLTTIAVESVVADAVRECEPLVTAKACHIIFSPTARPKIEGDAEHLRRAVGNVLRNAVRHSPEGNTIEVTLRENARTVLVTIRDFGSGVTPSLLNRIFDPFFQASSSRVADGGLGLGLSIAKRSIEMHGGQIWAENASPGLRVCINLPSSQIHARVSGNQPSASETAFADTI